MCQRRFSPPCRLTSCGMKKKPCQQTRGRKKQAYPRLWSSFSWDFPIFLEEHHGHVGFPEGCYLSSLFPWPGNPGIPCDCEGNLSCQFLASKMPLGTSGFMPLGPHRNDFDIFWLWLQQSRLGRNEAWCQSCYPKLSLPVAAVLGVSTSRVCPLGLGMTHGWPKKTSPTPFFSADFNHFHFCPLRIPLGEDLGKTMSGCQDLCRPERDLGRATGYQNS